MNKTRVLLADDHRLVRAGFRSLLEKIPSVEVVGEAKDGRGALELIEKHQPDVVLMDIAMPRLSGLEATARTRKRFPKIKVIMLSMYANEEYVMGALRAGACGYLIKDAAVGELARAIRTVMKGKSYFSPRVSKRVIANYLARIDGDEKAHEKLTPRQREILQLIAEGNSTKEIAFSLGLSGKTIDAHRAQLMKRLNIHDLPGLVRYAMRVGLVPVEVPMA
jgi:DNA-binding NarL/FixJ family response regulator